MPRETQPSASLPAHIDRAVLVLILLGLVAFAVHHIVAYDFWWQLKTGHLVRESGWPATDPFSYGFPDRVWIEVRWLYCVVISLIYDGLGPQALIVAKVPFILIGGLCLWLLGRGKNAWVVNLGLLTALMLMHQRFTIRPELVTYVMLPVYLFLISRFQATSKWVWLAPLPFLQIVWVNSHTLYILGPILLWCFAGAAVFVALTGWKGVSEAETPAGDRKVLGLSAVAVSLACLMNPYGIKGALFAFELFTQTMSDEALNPLVGELRSPFVGAGLTLLFVSYTAAIALSAWSFFAARRSLSLGWLGLWAAFLYLSVLAERNVALFGIVAGAAVIRNLGNVDLRPSIGWAARILSGSALLILIPAAVSNYYYRSIDPDRRFGVAIAERRFPIRAMEFVRAEGLPVPVVTNLGESGYVLFDQGPKSVYVDGRLEVYGPANIVSAVDTFSTGNGLADALAPLNVFTLVANLEADISLIQRLLQDPAWAAVYFDDSHIIFLRRASETQSAIAKLQIDWNSAEPRYPEIPAKLRSSEPWLPSVADNARERSLGQLYAVAGNVARAQPYLEQAIQKWPDDPRAAFQLGVIYRSQKRESEAAKLFLRVPATIADHMNNQILAASIYEKSGQMGPAADAWLKVTTLGGQSSEIYQHLAATAVASQKWDAAYIAFDRLSQTMTGDKQVLNNLGAVADKLNRPREALSALERSLAIDPAQAIVLTQVGVIRAKGGDVAGARQAFERALAVDPSFAPARQGLERLGGQSGR